MKRCLYIVDGEFQSFEGHPPYVTYQLPNPMLTHRVTESEQAAYEFGRQEKAEEILEVLSREFFGEKKP